MSLSAGEQYLLELINRARLDPTAEAERYNLDLNAGLGKGTIGTQSLQVLAPDNALESAATSHSAWMLNTDVFSHTGANGSSAEDRIQNKGYVFKGSWEWRENLAWVGSTGNVNMEAAILEHHEGLYRSEGHRVNTFAADVSELGIGQVAGKFNYGSINYNSSMLTLNYAKSGTEVFVTGVVYTDFDNDLFYSIGEGTSNYSFRVDGGFAKTASAGGFGIETSQSQNTGVDVYNGKDLVAQLEVDTTKGNVKLDIVTNTSGSNEFHLSGSADLGNGIAHARLLGQDNLSLSGSSSANRLTGNDGRNVIRGEAGNDVVFGGAGGDFIFGNSGRDALAGGTGNDKIRGGTGNDKMWGDGGRDTLIGEAGNDRIWGGAHTDKLNGGSGSDFLYGGMGNDILVAGSWRDSAFGDSGNDRIYGGSGADKLYGGSGNDRLLGGSGSDYLKGDSGADVFVFQKGKDLIIDFEDNIDRIEIYSNLLSHGEGSISDLINHAVIEKGDAVFNFEGGHTLTVNNVESLNILANDMIII